MKQIENLEAFIRQNAPYLTLSHMVEETGLSVNVIRAKCIALGISPIKGKDQTKQFVLTHHKYKTPAQIAKSLGCGEANLRNIYKELNIPFGKKERNSTPKISEKKPDPKNIRPFTISTSVREILGNFQLDPSVHYQGAKKYR